MRRLSSWWLCSVLACFFSVACGTEEPPINQVGVNVVEKAIFQGSWYMSRTVVDVDYEAAGMGTFPGDIASDAAQDFTALPRIRWVIDEDTLFAYRDYELVQGGDGEAKGGKRSKEAQERSKKFSSPVAAYKIEKHFDVRRDYSTNTGEERNVVVENDQDKPWFERKYMRVDWSKNLLPGYFGQTMNLYELLGNYTREATDLFVQDVSQFPKSYRPRFDRMSCDGRSGDGKDKDTCPDYERDLAGDYEKDELYHMSFVSQETLSPGLVPDPITGAPINWCTAKLYADAPACSSVVSYVRTSFLKVSDKRQYDPVNFEDDRFERFGYFRLAAPTVDRSNGDPDDPAFFETDFLNYSVNRHNIWQQWRDEDDQPIPYEERDVRQIVWYTTPELPAHLVEPSYDLVSQWNESFMETVRRQRNQKLPTYGEVQCQSERPDDYCYCADGVTSCPGRYDPFTKPSDYGEGTSDPYDCYVQVPSAVGKIDLDDPALSDEDFNPWFGSKFVGSECVTVLRTNTCNRASLAEASEEGTELECEERGDLRFKFLSYVDQPGTGFLGIATLRGDPITGEIIAGDANIGGPALDSYRTTALQTYDLIAGNLTELEFQVGEDVRGYFENLGRVSLPARPRQDFVPQLHAMDDKLKRELDERMKNTMTRLEKLKGATGRQAVFSDRLQKFVGTDLERRLVAGLNQEQVVSGAPGGGPSDLNESDLARLSPLRTSTKQRMSELHDRELRFSRANVTMPNEYADDSVQWFVSKHKDWTRARLEFAVNQLLYRQTQLHELGHCFGLRHDFGASADSEHYRPEYYEIAAKYPMPDPKDYDVDGTEGLSEPETRAFDAAYTEVRSKRELEGIDGAMSSSVMEYTANWYERLQPLGRYDHAAIAFGYGDLVEAYDGAPSGTQKREMIRYYQGGEVCQTDADCPFAADGAQAGNLLDANMANALTQRCIANPRVQGAKMCSSIDDDLAVSAEQGGRLQPLRYRFCSDERADTTIAWCNRFDEGENYRDIVRNIEESYDRMYPFSAFRRYRSKWNANSYTDALLGRRLNILQNIYHNLAYEYANNEGFRSQSGPFGFYDQFLATTDILNFYARILAQPSVGSYKYQAQTSTYQLWSYSMNFPSTQLQVPLGLGRYFWSDYQAGLTGIERLERVGTFFDKARVIELLAERGTAPEYTRDVAFFSNFYDLFPNEMQQIFNGMIRGAPEAYMPRLVCEGAGPNCTEPRFVYMDFYRGDCSKPETCRPNPAETTYGNLPVVDGGGSLTLQIYAALYGLAYFPVYFDTTFQNQLFVCIQGQADCYDPSPDAVENTDYVRYTSPNYRRTFIAFQVEPRVGVAEQTSIGFAMVKEAYELDIALSALRKMQSGPEPNSPNNLTQDERNQLQQIGYMLPTTPTAISEEINRVQRRVVDLESFLNQMVELQRQSNILPPTVWN